jgi:hypothetical protein
MFLLRRYVRGTENKAIKDTNRNPVIFRSDEEVKRFGLNIEEYEKSLLGEWGLKTYKFAFPIEQERDSLGRLYYWAIASDIDGRILGKYVYRSTVSARKDAETIKSPTRLIYIPLSNSDFATHNLEIMD